MTDRLSGEVADSFQLHRLHLHREDCSFEEL